MKTIAFYSYKGGVGRSLALANIAKRLSEFNKKVCILDFDLEAPGIPSKFEYELSTTQIETGIVDYLFDYSVNGNIPKNISNFSVTLGLHKSSISKGEITLIPAGNTDNTSYWKKLAQINWYELLYENENGISFFLDLKEKIRNEINPDFLLIDSRTGISEMSGISISLLAEEVVVIAANNKENLYGSKKIIELLNKSKNISTEQSPKITFVLSRIPFTKSPLDLTKEEYLIKRVTKELENIYVDTISVLHSDRDLEERERLKISSIDETGDDTSSQIIGDYLKLFAKLTKDDLTEDDIKKFNTIKEANRLFDQALDEESIEKKLVYLNDAINLNKDDSRFYHERISIFIDQKKYKEAKKDIDTLLKIDQRDENALYRLHSLYMETSKIPDAIQVAKNMIEYNPRETLGLFCLAYSYSELNDYANAIFYYEKVIELNPSDHFTLNNLANVYLSNGDIEKSKEYIFKALEIDPNSFFLLGTLAEIYANQGKDNEFYLNLEIAMTNDTEKELSKTFKKEKVYQAKYSDEKFIRLLNKYNYPIN